MKVQSLDKTHLLVVLSPNETDSLGIRFGERSQSAFAQMAVAKIFAAACEKTDFPSGKRRVSIHIAASQTGETLLLFSASTAPRKKYKIKNIADPVVFSFSNPDHLLDAVIRLRETDLVEKAELVKEGSAYRLILFPCRGAGKKICRVMQEYSVLYGKGSVVVAFVREHGQVLSGNILSASSQTADL